METNQNVIHSATFNFEYETKASASRCNTLIESIFNSLILPELEKAISNQIPEGILVELAKLEINIGNIEEKELENDLAERIKNALEGALNNKISHEGEEIIVYNSGLILFWPFLTRLFEILSLIKDGTFINPECKNRAAYILQHLVCNETDFSGPNLILNKLLSGIRQEEHLVPLTGLTDEERESTQSLLNGLINNWEKVKNSSPEGIRKTFLQREGILRFQKDKISLVVDKKGVDVLLESIPWNITLVKLSWMDRPIYVEWI